MTWPEGALLETRQRPDARGIVFWYPGTRVARADASCRYRIGHFLELTRGASAVRAPVLPDSMLEGTTRVVCVRPTYDVDVMKQLERLLRRGVEVIVDYDDLMFAGDIDGLPNHLRRANASICGALSLSVGVPRFTVSTAALAVELSAASQTNKISTVRNAISGRWVRQGRLRWNAPVDRVLRYFAGSPTHDGDFAVAADAVAAFLWEHPSFRLELVGPVDVDTAIFPPSQLSHLRKVPYDQLPKLLMSSWVCLSPLAPNRFSACKSAIKFLEAAAFGCPTLASPNEDVLHHVERGGSVALCENEGDWVSELRRLSSSEARCAMGAAAESYVLEHALTEHELGRWCAALGVQP